MVNVEKYINKKIFEYFYLLVIFSPQLLFIRGNFYFFHIR
jgi:hypothetical protein